MDNLPIYFVFSFQFPMFKIMSLPTQSLTYDIFTILVTLIIGFIAYTKWTFGYWTRRGLYQTKTTIPFGSVKDMVLGRKFMGEVFQSIYMEFKSKGLQHGGGYLFMKQFYVPVNLDLIKKIMQADFQHFVNHGGYVNEEADPLTGNLFALEDEKWRNLRIKLTPTFTSGKLKMMFNTMVDCTNGLSDILHYHYTNKEALDIKDIMGRFTTDIIGSCAFGLDINSMENPNSVFRKYGKKIFEKSTQDNLREIMQFMLPLRVLNIIGLRVFPKDIYDFFSGTVRETVEYREKNNIYRKDFMHLLLQLKNLGKVSDDEKIMLDGEKKENGLSLDEMTAQAFVFFLAGFETSSTTMTWALYELSTKPDIQKKLQEEIDRVLTKYDNKLTYDGMMEMTYMTKVLNETLRMYPPLALLSRKCSKDYKVPGTDIQIEKDTVVIISTLGIHRDPEYFPNPDVFDPENFNEENKARRHQYSWIPFGEGPRICIGLRFGLLQAKVGLVTLLKDYNIRLNINTKTPLAFSKNERILTAEGGIWLDVVKRDK